MLPEEKILRNRAYQKAYYTRHRAEVLTRTAAWNKAHPESTRKARQKYYRANAPRLIEASKAAMRKRRGIPEPTRPEPEVCEMCGCSCSRGLSRDHDHATRAFRGWLCNACNIGLGKLGDTITAVERTLEYLKRAQCQMKSQELPSPSPVRELPSNWVT